LSRRVLLLLERTCVAIGGTLTFVMDETLERRWGRHIRKRGHYHDPLDASKQCSMATSGFRWIVLTLVITPAWTQRPWALPVLTVPAPSPEVSCRLGLRHKTVPQRARQMLLVARRWLPRVEVTVIGDQTYSVHELGGACARWGVRLVAPLQLDTALYEPVPPHTPGTNGRPRVKGERLPQLKQMLKAAQTPWQRISVRWYSGRHRELDVTSGARVWYRIGQPVLPLR
jgi:DDE superfamily endonuclease